MRQASPTCDCVLPVAIAQVGSTEVEPLGFNALQESGMIHYDLVASGEVAMANQGLGLKDRK